MLSFENADSGRCRRPKFFDVLGYISLAGMVGALASHGSECNNKFEAKTIKQTLRKLSYDPK